MSRLRVRVTPRSSKNEVIGWKDNALAIKITSPPVEGAANRTCIEFLSKLLGISKSQITLVSGDKSRNKTFEIESMDESEMMGKLGLRTEH